MQWDPENTFDKLLRDENITSFYKRKKDMSEELKEILDLIEAETILSVRRANHWIHEGDPYGFIAEKQKSINFINLIRFLRNGDLDAAIYVIENLSNFDRRFISEKVIIYINKSMRRNEEN